MCIRGELLDIRPADLHILDSFSVFLLELLPVNGLLFRLLSLLLLLLLLWKMQAR